ncbi:L-fucose/L-arabinose isomerase family protein [Neorhodopirellula pilleata]|uniref:L-arabinose isomerase n=1 Tax=Neorhodopirellula pilleata TaxID=2714738 RepID=A0A5C6AU28_9BACT|nr:L-fucose/L-arabinose isomerase family protein [Neorhodopirellula pilleata]TWU03098.1 L-arabinose isomerase [Neorhodopirellula pilleata]
MTPPLDLAPIKPSQRPRIGLYSIGHAHYWDQFQGLLDRLLGYNRFLADRIGLSGEVTNVGMIDEEAGARKAVQRFRCADVDLIFCHAATYAMSASHIQIARQCGVPVVVLNLQPTAAMNYDETMTGEWLAHCVGCCVPEIANAMNRSGIEFYLISGLLGQSETPAISVADEDTAEHPESIAAWREIDQWVRAANVKRTIAKGRMGFLGHTYPGMLDMYSDFTMLTAQTGMHVEVLEMCDLERRLKSVTESEKKAKLEQVYEMFEVSEDSPTDPLARKPRPEQLDVACQVAVAQEKLVRDFDLDALTYYYRGSEGNAFEQLQEAFILGHSLLTAQGIPCSGEGDMKTAIAMKICDILGVGGSYIELVACDYHYGTIILGHDGPFHIGIADKKPILRGMGLYHGKWGTGVSVEATVRKGPVTTLNLTQIGDGRLRFLSNQGQAIQAPILKIGNTMTHVKFDRGPSEMMNRWYSLSPTHHAAMSVGHNTSQMQKVATLMGIDLKVVSDP